MDTSKLSPFPAATEVPLQRNPPLAPSQELAYRNKCIQLKRRLAEIEGNNDSTRKRIATEKERVQKMRLLRAILLNQVRDIMETPGKKFTPEQLQKLGIAANGDVDDEDLMTSRSRPEGEALMDDSSDESDEDVPEPSNRPTRARRQNNNYRETIMSSNTPNSTNPVMYQQSGLQNIAPAGSYSPAAPREPALANSFQTTSTGSPQYSGQQSQQFIQDPRYTHSSPIHTTQPASQTQARSTSLSQSQREQNGVSRNQSYVPQPVHPRPPYEQFCDHMRPQLEADNYPPAHIQSRIDEEWRKLSPENRALWDERYNDQMVDYERDMDQWKRGKRSDLSNPPSGGFSSMNRG